MSDQHNDPAKMKARALDANFLDTIKGMIAAIPPSVLQNAESKVLDLATIVLQQVEVALPATPGGFLVHAGEHAGVEALLKQIDALRAQLASIVTTPDDPHN